nr:MAG TPA: hypothetical protein [Caudoviricetes sp.]
MFLHVFVTFLLFLCIFMRLCVCALCDCLVACVGTMHGAWYWYACHASHHRRVFIIMLIMFVVDHH